MTNRLNGVRPKLKPADLERLQQACRAVAEHERALVVMRAGLATIKAQIAQQYEIPATATIELATGYIRNVEEEATTE